MATFPRAKNARPNGLVPGAPESTHLKPSELQALFHCSRSIAGKLAAREDFPRPIDLTGDGNNLRYALDEVLAWRNNHRREVRILKRPARTGLPKGPPIAPAPSAEAAVRRGLAALKTDKKPDPTGFR